VRTGEVLTLLGPNGTGKSTLLKCLAGLLRPLSGTVTLDGRELGRMAPQELARHVAYVPQTQVSPFPYRVRDIVLMGRAAHIHPVAMPRDRDVSAAESAMDEVGVTHLAERSCDAISGGEWQLTLIARAIAQETEILLLDEPTSHLDMGNQMRVLQVIHRLADRGITIVTATHFPDHALLGAGNVVVLKERMIAAQGPPEATITPGVLRATYGIPVEVVRLPEPVERSICVPLVHWNSRATAGREHPTAEHEEKNGGQP